VLGECDVETGTNKNGFNGVREEELEDVEDELEDAEEELEDAEEEDESEELDEDEELDEQSLDFEI